MTHPPISMQRGYAVVDVDGRVCWGLFFRTRQEASDCARHPKRRVVELRVGKVVRKLPPKRKLRRG